MQADSAAPGPDWWVNCFWNRDIWGPMDSCNKGGTNREHTQRGSTTKTQCAMRKERVKEQNSQEQYLKEGALKWVHVDVEHLFSDICHAADIWKIFFSSHLIKQFWAIPESFSLVNCSTNDPLFCTVLRPLLMDDSSLSWWEVSTAFPSFVFRSTAESGD